MAETYFHDKTNHYEIFPNNSPEEAKRSKKERFGNASASVYSLNSPSGSLD